MRPAVVPLFTVVVIGVVVGLFLQSIGSGVKPSVNAGAAANPGIQSANVPATATESADITELAHQLAMEIEARQALQEQVDMLAMQLTTLTRERQASVVDDRQALSHAANPDSTPNATGSWFDEQALINAGIAASEAQRIKLIYEEQELERLYLRDQAVREGWGAGKRRAAFRALASQQLALKTELGDAGYDAYLYASRQPNRVQVQGVLAGSAAADAGIQEGDYILRYNDQRVYSGQELRTATTGGSADEVVAISIQRGDTQQQVYIPRGPLGIRMSSASVAP